jgi:hypothetical protein
MTRPGDDRRSGTERRSAFREAWAHLKLGQTTADRLVGDFIPFLEAIVQEGGANSHAWLMAHATTHLATLRAYRERDQPRPALCPDCDHGIAGGQPCRTCGGSGYRP